jgi:hypothetical protein
LQKRVYWNTPNEVYRKDFERQGFEAFICPSRVRVNKSAADVIIALDALQSSYEIKDIQEYIILTTDTDFIALIEKLAERAKRTVAAANENNLSLSVYSDHADIVIPTFALRAAMGYQRHRKSITDFLRKERGPGKHSPSRDEKPLGTNHLADTVEGAPEGATAPSARGKAKGPRHPPVGPRDLEQAAEHLVVVAQQTPGLAIGKKTVIRALSHRMPSLRTSGPRSFFGCGSYNKMIERIARGRKDLTMQKYGNGGVAISYRESD